MLCFLMFTKGGEIMINLLNSFTGNRVEIDLFGLSLIHTFDVALE